jgi:hypothetical protein
MDLQTQPPDCVVSIRWGRVETAPLYATANAWRRCVCPRKRIPSTGRRRTAWYGPPSIQSGPGQQGAPKRISNSLIAKGRLRVSQRVLAALDAPAPLGLVPFGRVEGMFFAGMD